MLCPLSGIKVFDAWAGAISILGAATLALGLIALVTQSWAMLAAFIVAIVAMSVMATLHHAGARRRRHSPRIGAAHI